MNPAGAGWRHTPDVHDEHAPESVISDLLWQLKDAATSRGDDVLAASVELALRLHGQAEAARQAAIRHIEAFESAVGEREEARERLGAVLALIHELGDATEAARRIEAGQRLTGGRTKGSGWLAALTRRVSESIGGGNGAQDPKGARLDPFEDLGLDQDRIRAALDGPGRAGDAQEAPVAGPLLERVNHALNARVLGKFSLIARGPAVAAWNGTKGQSIFKYLLAQPGRAVHKEVLMELLWPDGDPEASRRSLHQAVYSLRKTLRDIDPEGSHVLFENDCYLLSPDLDIWVDAREFEARATTGLRLERAGRIDAAQSEYLRANDLFRGPYLEDSLYDDWSVDERQRLWSLFLDVAWHLGEFLLAERRYEESLALSQKVYAMDPCNEKAVRLMMRCYNERGQRELAVRQFAILEDRLQRDLGTAPSAITRQLLQDILG